MWSQYICVVVLVFAVTVSCTKPSIYHVLRIEVRTEEDVQWLLGLRESLENQIGADFWRPPNAIGQPVDVMLPEYFIGKFKQRLDRRNISSSILVDDVYGLANEQLQSMKSRANETEFNYGVYHTYEEIREWVTEFANKHSDIAEEFLVTKSYEGRQIAGVKLSVSNGVSKKRSVWFEGGIHAREWISPATVLFIANQLAEDYEAGDAKVRRILKYLDFYIVPTLNVDGYAYTWEGGVSRLWRKTRSPNPNTICKGTDGNRNWPYEWGGVRASTNPCNETFRGEGAASEVEIQGVIDFTTKVAKKRPFVVFIDWHSFSQMWMSPWSYSSQAPQPDDAADQLALAAQAVQALKSVHQTVFKTGPASSTMYEASGYSIDWAYDVLKVKYSYCVELRDLGQYGFLLPADQIIPSGEECYAAIKVVGKWVVDEIKAGGL